MIYRTIPLQNDNLLADYLGHGFPPYWTLHSVVCKPGDVHMGTTDRPPSYIVIIQQDIEQNRNQYKHEKALALRRATLTNEQGDPI